MRPLLRLAIGVAPLLYPLWASADTISLEPSTQDSVVGSTVFLDIMASGLQVGAFDLTVSFDPLLLSPTGVEFDSFLGVPLSSLQFSSLGFDSVKLAETSLLSSADLVPMQQGDFRLARLDFETLAAGVTTISFSDALVSDPDAAILSPTLSSATVTIASSSGGAVPEPVGGLPYVAGLLVLGSIAIRRRERSIRGG